MLSFTVASKHACKQNSLLCYNDIKMCYFETSPYAMKCMLCHHLHSMFSIPTHDDAIKVSVPAASANQLDILFDQIIGTEINARLREGAALFLTKMNHFRYISTEHPKANATIHHQCCGKKRNQPSHR